MRLAIEQAGAAESLGEVPIGAVMVHDGEVIASGHNRREIDCDPLAHAEIAVIAASSKRLRRWRLSGCTLYVTLEPCPMCAGALVNARVDRVVYATRDPRAGAVDTHYQIGKGLPLNHTFETMEGVLREVCAHQLSTFFARKRALNRGTKPKL
jgi:tRNA(adenine34) deaminase